MMRFAALAVSCTLMVGPALGQGAPVSFGTGASTSDQPVEVTADQLDLDQEAGTALFTGNVLIVQGELRLSGQRVDVTYGSNATGETEIRQVDATGSVTLINGADAAEAERAVYSIGSGQVVMTGDVLLTQGSNAIAGERLTVNVDTGAGVMEGRVRVLFYQGAESGE